jgi:hypothetical protein
MVSSTSSHLGAAKSVPAPGKPSPKQAAAGLADFLLALPVPLALLAQDQRLLKCNPFFQDLLPARGDAYTGRVLRNVLEQAFELSDPHENGLVTTDLMLQHGSGDPYRVHLLTPPGLEVADVPVREVVVLRHCPAERGEQRPAEEALRRENQELEQQLTEVGTRLALLEWSLDSQSKPS